MGYHAIGVGDDDLSLGKKFLIDLSKQSPIPFLSSNIMDEDSKKAPFHHYIIKEINGLKVGIFSLLSPDVFLGSSDPRKKGLIFRNPFETAQETVKELEPKTDLIILLSHLGYPKDVELAQKINGIQIIIGSHTGVDLANPPVIKYSIILQNPFKGMYGRKLQIIYSIKRAPFYNLATKQAYERNLGRLREQLSSASASEIEKKQWRNAMENIEGALHQFKQMNPFTIASFLLGGGIKDHPEIKKMIEEYKSKFPEKSEHSTHDSRGTYYPKP